MRPGHLLSFPQLPHLKNGNDNSTCHIGLSRGRNGLTDVLRTCLVHGRHHGSADIHILPSLAVVVTAVDSAPRDVTGLLEERSRHELHRPDSPLLAKYKNNRKELTLTEHPQTSEQFLCALGVLTRLIHIFTLQGGCYYHPFQRKELSHREVRSFAQGYTAGEQWRQTQATSSQALPLSYDQPLVPTPGYLSHPPHSNQRGLSEE